MFIDDLDNEDSGSHYDPARVSPGFYAIAPCPLIRTMFKNHHSAESDFSKS